MDRYRWRKNIQGGYPPYLAEKQQYWYFLNREAAAINITTPPESTQFFQRTIEKASNSRGDKQIQTPQPASSQSYPHPKLAPFSPTRQHHATSIADKPRIPGFRTIILSLGGSPPPRPIRSAISPGAAGNRIKIAVDSLRPRGGIDPAGYDVLVTDIPL